MRNSVATACCRSPCADWSPASVSARSSWLPSTDTYTRAWRRSLLVSTEVTVTNPMRGSLTPSASRADTTSRTASFTRRMRSAMLEKVFPRHHSAFHARALGKHRDHEALDSRGLIPQRAGVSAHDGCRELRTLPEIVMVGLCDGRAEAALQLSLQRAQFLPLALETSVVREVQLDL